jgi:UDP-N-acetylmuramate--alanine ligase
MAEQGCAPAWRGAVAALAPALADALRPGDLVVTMGAGDVTHVGPALLATHRSAAT